ncbi:MAG TPA: CocE/NonD family hydrolase, partial [Magnetospirillum sp.]|nr:CocE/NonD family hydrolase [Magnetospirillum sp.]
QARLPVALIAHGKPRTRQKQLDAHPDRMLAQARDLALRGWLSVVVMRRGFGASDGSSPVRLSCRNLQTLKAYFDASADDLQGTIKALARRADADTDRVIVVGASAGGAAAVALAARNPKGLVAVVSVSGGLHSFDCDKDPALIDAYAQYGARSRVPSLWVYARNDSLFSVRLVDRLHRAFVAAGGDAKLVMVEDVGDDGHTMFNATKGRHLWLTELDGFLRRLKLPVWPDRHIDSLVKSISTKTATRDVAERYLSAPSQKAFAASADGHAWGSAWGYKTMAEARSRAVAECGKRSMQAPCGIVMENYTAPARPAH